MKATTHHRVGGGFFASMADVTTQTDAHRDTDNFSNPLIAPSELPFQLPPFADIKIEHFLPAFDTALLDHEAEINAIVNNPEPATWANTVEALEASGRALERVSAVFFNLHGTDSSPEMDAIAEQIIPKLSEHSDALYQNEVLYQRLQQATPPADDGEGQRLKDKLLRSFRRRGAELDAAGKKRLSELNSRLAVLSEQFGKNLRESTAALAVGLTEDDVAGWDEARKNAARKTAEDYKDNPQLASFEYVVPLGLPAVQPDQTDLDNPAARKALMAASLKRGVIGGDNGAVVTEIAALRAQRARLLGYDTHADYVLEEETAGSTDAVMQLLRDLSPAASANAAGEYKLLVEEAQATDPTATVRDADWSYWESKVKQRDYSLNEAELKKYFPLDQVLRDGVFYAANRLYGITVEPRDDLQGYHPEVAVYEVKDADGSSIGLFLTDYFARPSKRGGAWMSSFVDQSRLLDSKPVVVNVMNITKPADGSQPLLSIDEVHTLFHEFGHGLHGLLSDVRYPTFSGTNVPRDYVEFPSQINENWAFDPAVVRNYARHVDTGEVITDELIAAVDAAAKFGQGFATSEYLAASIIDMAWHTLTPEQAAAVNDIDAFERAALADAGLEVDNLHARYKSRFFNHIFGGGYSAGYYSYLWAEALDADGFEWFKETGAAWHSSDDAAARAAGARFRELVLSAGGSRDYEEAFTTLRGRAKDVTALLERRGLAGAR